MKCPSGTTHVHTCFMSLPCSIYDNVYQVMMVARCGDAEQSMNDGGRPHCSDNTPLCGDKQTPSEKYTIQCAPPFGVVMKIHMSSTAFYNKASRHNTTHDNLEVCGKYRGSAIVTMRHMARKQGKRYAPSQRHEDWSIGGVATAGCWSRWLVASKFLEAMRLPARSDPRHRNMILSGHPGPPRPSGHVTRIRGNMSPLDLCDVAWEPLSAVPPTHKLSR